MSEFLKIAGWFFTAFYLYQTSVNLPEYFSPRSVMPCVTRILDAYILWFVFPLGFVMSGIIISDIVCLRRGYYTGLSRWFILSRDFLGVIAVAAGCVAAARIMSAC